MAENYFDINELISEIDNMIQEIRKSPSSYQSLIKEINNLESTYGKIIKFSDVNIMFGAYKKIQEVSIKLRKLLPKYILEANQYDNISYAFYYTDSDGKTIRYSTDQLKIEWLRVGSTSGELQINLTKAINDIAGSELNTIATTIFKNRYESYYKLITNTYNPRKPYKGKTYKRAPLNKGHISEAFEEHLSQHHPSFYNLLNSGEFFNNSITDASVLEKMAEVQIDGTTNWDIGGHESVTQAWMHVRHSMGTQRGTVAGDVGKYQVKYGSSENPKLRLARFSTIKQGIDTYSMILNPNKNSKEVATLIAYYMTERISKTSERLLDAITDKEIKKLLENFDNNIKNNITFNI